MRIYLNSCMLIIYLLMRKKVRYNLQLPLKSACLSELLAGVQLSTWQFEISEASAFCVNLHLFGISREIMHLVVNYAFWCIWYEGIHFLVYGDEKNISIV